jgi:hypothetical protein
MKTDANIKATAAQIFKSAVSGPARQCAIFLESVRFHDLLANKNPPNWLGRIQRLAVWDYVRNKLPFLTPRNLDDIRLSTAAHNSARFPIVSPAGEIRNLQHQVVDRIVDGGYFENYGALGAMELAQAIRAIEPKLAPFVLGYRTTPMKTPISPRSTSPTTRSLPTFRSRSRPLSIRGRRVAGLPSANSKRPWKVSQNRIAAVERHISAYGRVFSRRPTVILKMCPALSR